MFLSSSLAPRTLILASLVMTVLSALLLATTAGLYLELLYLGTGATGYFVSLQFASGYSWLADQVDLTGRGSSVVFLGANLGWLVFPPLAGMVFSSSVGPMGVFYLTLGRLASYEASHNDMIQLYHLLSRSQLCSPPSLPFSAPAVFQ